ncbi:MAG: HepT-like ribonuclease domain-containing protein [Pseudomonadota bacterium]
MAPRSTLLHLADLRDAIRDIERYAKEKEAADYIRDSMLRAAIERKMEVISEASRRIPVELKSLRPEVPWRKVADLGNVLRHEYHRVDPLIVWNIITSELPALKRAVRAMWRAVQSKRPV